MKQEIPLNKYFIEACVIVSSILLAFAIDAWWAERTERILEQDYLNRLLQDQRANLDVITAMDRQHSATLTSARRIYPYVSSGNLSGLEGSSIVNLSYSATPTPSPTWINDTFEELKSSGSFGLIKNIEVRSTLLEYYRFLERADYTYELMSTDYRDAVRSKIDPEIQLAFRGCRPGYVVAPDRDCEIDYTNWDTAGYIEWLGNNDELADGLRRVIVQFSRAKIEYLARAFESTTDLIELIEKEMVGS